MGQLAANLFLHFGYHKCLTLFFSRIYRNLGNEFGIHWQPVYDDAAALAGAIFDRNSERIVLVTDNDDIPWKSLPDFRACHVIRDPRDMVVSGYFYHLWTDEAWCRSPDFAWEQVTRQRGFEEIESNPAHWPRRISYQHYLNSLDQERGLLLEMLSRADSFRQMAAWDYARPAVLELRYESIVGNEQAQCSRLFDHLGFTGALRTRADQLVEKFALRNLARKPKTHVRSGKTSQWKETFTPGLRRRFREAHGQLLVDLGYERNLDW